MERKEKYSKDQTMRTLGGGGGWVGGEVVGVDGGGGYRVGLG